MRVSLPETSFPRRALYPIIGAVLAAGAPLGYLAFLRLVIGRAPTVAWLVNEIASESQTYIYMTISTAAVFIVLGLVLGHRVDQLRATSIADPLTKLANRRHLEIRLEQELVRAARRATPVSVIWCDVDHLKNINDRFGHEAGDAALTAVANALSHTCRASDLAARFGGDEFMILAPDTTAEQARELAERIRATLAQASNGVSTPTLSIGIADLDRAKSHSMEALFQAADEALYAAKAVGRDCVVVAPERGVCEFESRGPVPIASPTSQACA